MRLITNTYPRQGNIVLNNILRRTTFVLEKAVWVVLAFGRAQRAELFDASDHQELLRGVAVLATFLGLSGCMLTGMWGGHIYLIMTNQTTFEQLKDRSPGPELWYLHGMPLTALPFSHGTWNNIVDFFTLNPRLDDRQDRQDVMQQHYAKDETWWDNRHYNCC